MTLTASAGELATLALSLVAGGAITGLLAGLFGIGGGTVIVPVLYQLFGFMGVPEAVRMHLCIGTSLAAIIPTSYRSYRAHRTRGAVDSALIRQWAAPVIVGAVLGGQLIVLVMTLYNRPIHQAVATSAGLGILTSIPGTLGFIVTGLPEQALMPPLSMGYVSLIGAALLAPISTWVAPLGVRLAHSFSRRRLEVAFGLWLLLIAARFAWSLAG